MCASGIAVALAVRSGTDGRFSDGRLRISAAVAVTERCLRLPAMKRRDFVKLTAMASAATLLPWQQRVYAAFAQSPGMQKFVAPMLGLGNIAAAFPVKTFNEASDVYD